METRSSAEFKGVDCAVAPLKQAERSAEMRFVVICGADEMTTRRCAGETAGAGIRKPRPAAQTHTDNNKQLTHNGRRGRRRRGRVEIVLHFIRY